MGKLKFECQAIRDQSAYDLVEPTVHVASQRARGQCEPFNTYARRWSAYVGMKAASAATFRLFALRDRKSLLSGAALPPTPELQAPHLKQWIRRYNLTILVVVSQTLLPGSYQIFLRC
jgi:hypothetical protein